MLVVYADFPVDLDQFDEAREMVARLVGPSREEGGIHNHNATVDVRDDTVIRVFEQ